jgi:hypothetical protein
VEKIELTLEQKEVEFAKMVADKKYHISGKCSDCGGDLAWFTYSNGDGTMGVCLACQERMDYPIGQRVIIEAPKQVYANGGMSIRKSNKKEKQWDGKKGKITKKGWGTYVGCGYDIKLDDGSTVTLNYLWVNKLEASDEVPPCPDCGGKRDEDYLCPNCVINPPKEEADEEDIWCHCGEKSTFGSYPEDGECSCGMHKHHVHCGTCGKISQVG